MMSVPINLSKVLQPQKRRETLRRARLIDKLHDNIHRKLTYLSAPAGYGKTSLLVDFASDLDARVCWYHITPGDEDLRQFGLYLVSAFQQKFPGFGQRLDDLFQAPNQNLEPRNLGVEIINQIVTSIDDFCVLILDDYHIVGETQPVVDLVETLLDHLPDQVRLVIASRNEFGIPTAKLYVRGEMMALSADDLRFRADEIQALVRQNYRYKLSVRQATELAKRSDGWIVAILLGMRQITSGEMPNFDGSSAEQVYNFLAAEVIQKEKAALRDFMLATSVVDEFNEPLSSYLLEIPSSKDLIRELERRNLFITSVQTSNGTSYRYHQLFWEFLQNQLARREPEKKRKLHRRAAAWFYRHKQWEQAVFHKLAAGEREEAAQWMDQAAKHMFVAGKAQVLNHWYEVLQSPTDIRRLAPQLFLNQAKSLVEQGNYEAAEQLLDMVEPIFRENDNFDQWINAKITRAIILQNRRGFSDALALVNEIQAQLSSHGYQTDFRWYQTERIKGFCLGHSGKAEQAIQHLEQAIEGFKGLLNNSQERALSAQIAHDWGVTLTDLGTIYYEIGRMLEAQNCMCQALEIQRQRHANPALIASSLNNIGFLFYQSGQYQKAWQAFQEAKEILKNLESSRYHIYLNNSLGDFFRDLDEWDAAEEAYRKAIEKGKKYQAEVLLFASYAGLASLEKLRGNYNQAFHWLREAAKVRHLTAESARYQLKLGEIYLAMGQLPLAVEALEKAFHRWASSKQNTQDFVKSAFLLGRAHFEQGRPAEALEFLNTALEGAARLGYDQFLVVEGRRARAFLKFAQHTYPAQQQLKSLIERVERFKAGLDQFRTRERAPQPGSVHLEIRAFGPARVWHNGALLQKSAWRSSKARALFFYIMDRKGARGADIKRDFWPEFNSNRANSNLQATLWRTRNAIGGKDVLINQGDSYSLAPHVTCWYDVDEFRDYLARARRQDISEHERAELWRRAIELYQGDYLEDVYMDWTDEARNELRDLYLNALIQLANWEFDQRHFAEACRLYEKALATDPYRDDIHLSIMQCQLRAGSPSSAQNHYLRYKTFLNEEGLAPSPELEDFFEQISNP